MIQNLKAHFFVLLATFLVAGSFLISSKISGVIDSILLTLFRFFIASLFLAPVVFLKKEFREKILYTIPRAMIISLFYSLYFIGLFKALETTTALNTGTLFTLVPLITAILCIFLLKEKMTLNQLFIYILGIIGTCIVVFKADINLFFNFSLNHGDLIFLFAIVCMSFYSIFAKLFYKKDDELIVLVFCTLLCGCFWMFLALEVLDIPIQLEKLNQDFIFYMFYLVIAATLMTTYLYQQAAINIGPKKVMAYIYLNPVIIAFLMYMFEKRVLNFGILIGILISTFATMILLKQK